MARAKTSKSSKVSKVATKPTPPVPCGEGDPSRELTPFEAKVAEVIRAIPKGTTLPYSGVALRAGKPGAARAVVRAMKNLSEIPWWRVNRRDGTLAPQVATEQRRRLVAEGWKEPKSRPRR